MLRDLRPCSSDFTPESSYAGIIDYEEFIAATINLNRLEQETAYQKAFQVFDTDNSGFLSIEEIKEALAVSVDSHLYPKLPLPTPLSPTLPSPTAGLESPAIHLSVGAIAILWEGGVRARLM